jgi:hypothetical protein
MTPLFRSEGRLCCSILKRGEFILRAFLYVSVPITVQANMREMARSERSLCRAVGSTPLLSSFAPGTRCGLTLSVNRNANGRPPAPGRWYMLRFRCPGAGVLSSSPGYLER